jgi:hypothetical protein
MAEGPLATVCQHIGVLQHLEALRSADVTDLFWSHTTRSESRRGGVRLHPFPLWPVRCLSHPPDGTAAARRSGPSCTPSRASTPQGAT